MYYKSFIIIKLFNNIYEIKKKFDFNFNNSYFISEESIFVKNNINNITFFHNF